MEGMQKISNIQKKENVCTPTVHNDSGMIPSVIDAYKRRDVMTIDCPGAFLQAMASDLVLMKLRRPIVKAFLMIDPVLYRDYILSVWGQLMFYASVGNWSK